jgi:arginyl-tRNA synthetase
MSESISIETQLASAILDILSDSQDFLNCTIPASVAIERPKNRAHGDYASSVALSLAKVTKKNPISIANHIASALRSLPIIAKVDVAGAGFINITIVKEKQNEIISTILKAGNTYGYGDSLEGSKINLEFIHLGHARWAAVGDSLGNILQSCGAEVVKEFYINDRGVQILTFGASLYAWAKGGTVEEKGYHGEYIEDLANQIVLQHPDILTLDKESAIIAFSQYGYRLQLEEQKASLKNFRNTFDVWFSENTLYDDGFFNEVMAVLYNRKHLYYEDGAIWLNTSAYGDDKDRVLIKADSTLAYFASDCAYFANKSNRGFDTSIYMLGADHHGYSGRLNAIASCLEDTPTMKVEVLIGQLVKIVEAGLEIKLSKRAGTIVTLDELVDKVGVDAARYTLVRYPVDSAMTLDVDLLKKESNDNPVYYVQYAHARICSVLDKAKNLGINYSNASLSQLSLLTDPREEELIGFLAQYPKMLAFASSTREPHRIPRYLEELASIYHSFYTDCRVLPLDAESPSDLHIARASLSSATAQVIFNALSLLNVSAPTRMAKGGRK